MSLSIYKGWLALLELEKYKYKRGWQKQEGHHEVISLDLAKGLRINDNVFDVQRDMFYVSSVVSYAEYV